MIFLISGVKLTLMKKLSLYVFLGFLWCNVGFAEIKINCTTEAHAKNYSHNFSTKREGVTYDEWLDLGKYKYEVKTLKKNKIYMISDVFIEVGLDGTTFDIVENDQRYLVGKKILRDSEGIIVEHLVYDKKSKFLTILYYSDYGVKISEGYCS